MLLRRPGDAGHAAFEAAVVEMGRQIAKLTPGNGVSLDLCKPDAQPAPADALIYVENTAAALPGSRPGLVQVISVLDVETHSSIG